MNSGPLKTVVVMGVAYGGKRAADLLSKSLPSNWRLIVIDRNSHFNHLYAFPRFAVMPQHAPKAYIPYTHLFDEPESSETPLTPPTTPPATLSALDDPSSSSSDVGVITNPKSRHQFIQASIVGLTTNSVTFVRPTLDSKKQQPRSTHSPDTYGKFDGPEETIDFDYCVYALGASMPSPVNVWSEIIKTEVQNEVGEDQTENLSGTKKHGIKWMENSAEKLKKAGHVVVVGAGAMGIQFASDLKCLYPTKQVTLLHSRTRVMPRYPIEFHVSLIEELKKLGVEVVLGERVMTWPKDPEILDGKKKIVTTDHGRTFEADIVLPCTGQKPHIALMASVNPSVICPQSGRIRVHPTLQVHALPKKGGSTVEDRLNNLSLSMPPTPPPSEPSSRCSISEESSSKDLSHIFACGDCAETGAIQAGHTAYYQSEVAARNIIRLIHQREAKESKYNLEDNDKVLENYKVSHPAIKVTVGIKRGIISNAEGVKINDEGVEDLHSMVMWPGFGFKGDDIDINE
ncbi:uncharacterized protein I206_103217 [Kwoniella pini CBS 10737]|uniref:FAD/NAD(P)-binding domain-containing protein n=1 Tax=Kwoniella pini CBS 10737 TaxID=1296096 RepID=A0A1B9IA72_9TREE|nr:uncharacterized protein I206_01778 [Kwoniella pini CBS 10737]OCF52488.1 hypothetical protein I206_01778 [Kwoniella pini CBS 10737]